MSIIVPGDRLPVSEETLRSKKLTIGPCIYVDPASGNGITVSNAGVFTHKERKTKQLITVEASSKSYTPSVGDFVIGIVTGTWGESFKVQLCDRTPPAYLSYMAFESATKKNRPNLKTGSLVYAKVTSHDINTETEIECFNSTTGKSDGFGELSGGNVVQVDLAFARHLMFNEDNEVLKKLSEKCRFEVAIGVNGYIWIKTESIEATLAASKYLEKAASVPQSELGTVLRECFESR